MWESIVCRGGFRLSRGKNFVAGKGFFNWEGLLD